jgi:C1A family cysteine protease
VFLVTVCFAFAFPNTALAVDSQTLPATGAVPASEELVESNRLPESGSLTPLDALPSSIDNTSMYPTPGNQGGQGSCSSWATAYYKSYQEYADHGRSLNFSPSYLYNQKSLKSNFTPGQDSSGIWHTYDISGSHIWDNMVVAQEQGICLLSEMPYIDYDSGTQPGAYQKTSAYPHRSEGVAIIQGTSACKRAIYETGGVVIEVSVRHDLLSLSPSNSIYNVYDSNPYASDAKSRHALCLIGYDDSKQAFKFINSWGTTEKYSGLKGYGWISYDLVNNDTTLNGATPVIGYRMTDLVEDDYSQIARDTSLENGAVVTISSAINSNQNLDISGSSTSNGGSLIVFQNTNLANQRFRLTKDVDGWYTITNVNSGLVLEVSGSNPASSLQVTQWALHGKDNQKWAFSKNSDGSYTIIPKIGVGYCLDISGGIPNNSTKVILYPNKNQQNQKFKVTRITQALPNGNYTLKSVKSGKMMDVPASSKSNSVQLDIWDANNVNNQLFTFTYDANTGYYTIKNVNSGLLLDIQGDAKTGGSKIVQYQSNGSINQRWYISKDAQGNYTLYLSSGGLAVDVEGGSIVNGGKLILWASTGNSNQKWILTKK